MQCALKLLLFFSQASFALTPLGERLQKAGSAQCTSLSLGDSCVVRRTPDYSQPVVLLIPNGMAKPKGLVLYMHGFRGVCGVTDATPASAMSTRYKLLEQLSSAGATDRAIVFPMSRGKCNDYDNQLVPNFSSFAAWAENLLLPEKDVWLMLGHSGAGKAMANIAGQYKSFARRLDVAGLLDAAYGMGNLIGRWQVAAGANRRLKIRSYYATSSPESGSRLLQRTIPSQAEAILSNSYGDHCNVPMKDFGPALADRDQLDTLLAEPTLGL